MWDLLAVVEKERDGKRLGVDAEKQRLVDTLACAHGRTVGTMLSVAQACGLHYVSGTTVKVFDIKAFCLSAKLSEVTRTLTAKALFPFPKLWSLLAWVRVSTRELTPQCDVMFKIF